MSKIDKEEEKKLHIAMFPWLALGHINPFFELAKLFAQKGHKISFISTPKNIDGLSKFFPNPSPLINFIKLPMPRVNNLPFDAENTADLPPENVPILKKAHDLLREPMSQALASSNPDWLVHDFASYWLHEISKDLRIRKVFFSTFTVSSLVFVGTNFPDSRTEPEDFLVPPRWVPFPTTIAFRRFEVSRIFNDLTGKDDDVPLTFRLAEAFRGCDAVAVRTCCEIEKEWLLLLEDLIRKPVFPVGILPWNPHTDGDGATDTWGSIKPWLDDRRKGSVIYVALGTEAKLSQDEANELALGLEFSGFPFFWVLRAGQTSSVRVPTGFEDRNKGRGRICTVWAPQKEVLAHDSVGAFLSHGGWGSVIEGLQFARPLVLLGCSNDQGLNLRLLEEKKIGYSVPRDENDGLFTRYSVAESLKLVMESEEGLIYRERAKEMSAIFGDREMQENYVNKFLEYLLSLERKESDVMN